MQTDINAAYFKSIIDQDRCSVVICNLKHEIIYMNPTAVKSYEKWGGESLVGRSLLNCHNEESQKRIQQVIDWFAADAVSYTHLDVYKRQGKVRQDSRQLRHRFLIRVILPRL